MKLANKLASFIGIATIVSLVFWKFQLFTFEGYTLYQTSTEAAEWSIVILLYGILLNIED